MLSGVHLNRHRGTHAVSLGEPPLMAMGEDAVEWPWSRTLATSD